MQFARDPGNEREARVQRCARTLGAHPAGCRLALAWSVGLLLAALHALPAHAQVEEAWARRYSGLSKTFSAGIAVAVDGAGNAYVTGRFHNGRSLDYRTIKYDASGQQVWVRDYDGSGREDDRSWGIVVDGAGRVTVTGTGHNGTDTDYTTVQYDSEGNLLWVRHYNGPVAGFERAFDIAVDGAGNVTVTGSSPGSESTDFATVQYDRDGNERWVRRYSGPSPSHDGGRVLAVDGAGGITVGGVTDRGVGTILTTIRYDAEGNELWVRHFRRIGALDNIPTGVAVDAAGQATVTGYSDPHDGDSDTTTIRYDAEGNELWVRHYQGPAAGDDRAWGIVADGAGNVYVTGESDGIGTGSDYATIRYDAEGDEVWVRRHDGPDSDDDEPAAIGIDGEGRITVAGESAGGGDRDLAVLQYDADGNELWSQRYGGPSGGHQAALALAVDASGGLVVTGTSGNDGATVRYDSAGNLLWASAEPQTRPGPTQATAMATDADGNVYVTGYVDSWGGDQNYVTVKYDGAGNELWSRTYDGPGKHVDRAWGIVVDGAGRVTVTGESVGDGTGLDSATIQYDSEGKERWIRRHDHGAGHTDGALAIAGDGAGRVTVTGFTFGPLAQQDCLTLQYDSEGNESWVRLYAGAQAGPDWCVAAAVDGAGRVTVAGSTQGSAGQDDHDFLVLQYDADGNERWAARHDGPAGAEDSALAVAVDGAGGVTVTGYTEVALEDYDFTTLQYDADGNELWAQSYAGPGGGEDYSVAVALDGEGRVTVTGISNGAGTHEDFATVQYDGAGNELWVRRYDGPAGGNDRGASVAVDGQGTVWVTGASEGSGTGLDFLTLRYDRHGNPIAVLRHDGPASLADEAQKLVVDANGDVLITGSSQGETDREMLTVKYAVLPNTPPAADAGPDVELACTGAGGASVALDGSGSFDPDGDSLYFTWRTAEGAVAGGAASVQVQCEVGEHSFTLEVDDGRGGQDTDGVAVTVVYGFAGFLRPLKADGSAVFRSRKPSLPVKFRLACLGADGAPAVARVDLRRLDGGDPVGGNLARPHGRAGSGTLFRYDAGTQQYVYNLSLRGLQAPSRYRITVLLDDGKQHSVDFTLRL